MGTVLTEEVLLPGPHQPSGCREDLAGCGVWEVRKGLLPPSEPLQAAGPGR